MGKTIEQLEEHRSGIYRQMAALGDFRPGMISVNYRRCGKPNCACASKEHPGHGPQYLWNATQKGKSRAQNLHLGPELAKVQGEVANYKQFGRLCQEAIKVNEALCFLRPAPEIEDEQELNSLKKKLRRKFFKRPGGKSIG